MNRLRDESSPYLLQHADNPVEWQPWDSEALALAKREKKPILLSIGFSANHLCRQMARESFSNVQIAKLMNDSFINIKVDREERPDLDRIYQSAHQLLNRAPGGWPLTVFIDPDDHLPLFSGTYFPPQASRNAPSFRDVLKGMEKTFNTPNDKLDEFKQKLGEALSDKTPQPIDGEFDKTVIDRACGQIDSSFDAKRGGFSEAPKYPHATGLALMLDAAECISETEKSDRLFHMLDVTLNAMSRGGLYDHLAGGFFRYAVDTDWSIPSFEKMTNDNGLLLSVYTARTAQSGAPWLGQVAQGTADWLLGEMQLEHGGFGSSLAADTDDGEGQYYVWTRDEINELLGEGYDEFAEAYCLNKKKPNYNDKWHLHMTAPDVEALDAENLVANRLSAARARLLDSRASRAAPQRDNKILTSWNALIIRGLAEAGQQFERSDYIDAAVKALDYLKQHHWRNGQLMASSHQDRAEVHGYLNDYAFLLDAVLTLLAARWRDADLSFAVELADALLKQCEDTEHGGFFFTQHGQEALIQRNRPFADDSLPAGNAVAIRALLELGHLIDEKRYLDAAERALRCGMGEGQSWPSAHATLMRAVLDFMQPPLRAVVWSDDPDAATSWTAAFRDHSDTRGRCYVLAQSSQDLPGALAEQSNANLSARVYCGSAENGTHTDLASFKAAITG